MKCQNLLSGEIRNVSSNLLSAEFAQGSLKVDSIDDV